MLAEQRERERIMAEQRERERERMAMEMRERVLQVKLHKSITDIFVLDVACRHFYRMPLSLINIEHVKNLKIVN